MESFLSSALSAITTAASNPLAFAAYLFVVGAWTVIAFRVNRNKQLLRNLEKLPEQDRLQVLRDETGVGYLKTGLSAEEWLQARQQFYYLLAVGAAFLLFAFIFVIAAYLQQLYFLVVGAALFLVLCGLLITVAVIRDRRLSETAHIDVSLYNEPSTQELPPRTRPPTGIIKPRQPREK